MTVQDRETPIDVDRSLNDKLSRWTAGWNRPDGDTARGRAVDFLEQWRDREGDWFTDVSERFLELTEELGLRDFDWASGFEGELQKLLYANHTLWHFEDEVRRDDITPEEIVELKRGVDAVNQQRNDQMERLDEYVLSRIDVADDEEVPIQSEPPGLILDRLTIMTLKHYHYDAQEKQEEVETLREQRDDLETAFFQLIEALEKGERRVKVYRQLKTYNDPETNPALEDGN